MKLRNVVTVLLMSLIPALGFAQGKGKGHGKHKGAKVHKAANARTGNKWKGKDAVKVRQQQGRQYTGFKPKGGPPPWAPAHGYRAKQHVYFPDYHTFYDPYRGGYSYWQNNTWNFSPSVPAFLGGIDLGAARIQLLGDVPLTTRPETYYNRYSTMYPARSVNISIPVPGR